MSEQPLETAPEPERARASRNWRLVAAAVAGVVVLAACVYLLAWQVRAGNLAGFDRQVFDALRDPGTGDPVGPPWLEQYVRDVTALAGGPVLTLVTLAAAFALAGVGRYRWAVLVVWAAAGSYGGSQLLKLLFDLPRPDVAVHRMLAAFHGYPSGHSAQAAAVYLALAGLLAAHTACRWSRGVLAVLGGLTVLLVGFSRVYLGVHWPTDVLGGWAFGIAWTILGWLVVCEGRRPPRPTSP
jgi:undecaprenyl-diphosphatase